MCGGRFFRLVKRLVERGGKCGLSFAEFAQRFADCPTDFRQLARSENNQPDDQNYYELSRAYAEHVNHSQKFSAELYHTRRRLFKYFSGKIFLMLRIVRRPC